MKKEVLLTLVALSCLTLGSCGKKVSYDEANTFASDTWSEIEFSYSKCLSKAVVEVKKAEGIYASMFEVGTNKNEMEIDVDTYTFDEMKSVFDDSYSYSISGKKLTVSKSVKTKDYLEEEGIISSVEGLTVSGKGLSEVYKFNEEGLLTFTKLSLDMSFSATNYGISGAINMVSTLTNTYSK